MTVRSTAAPLMGTVRRRSALRNAWQRFRRKMVRSQLVSLKARLGANASQQGSGPILLTSSCLGAMLALASPVHSEDAAARKHSNQLAPAQALTITDLEGRQDPDQTSQRDAGAERRAAVSGNQDTDWKITVELGRKNRLEFPADLSQPAMVTAQARKLPRRPRWINLGTRRTAKPSGSSLKARSSSCVPSRMPALTG